jgi:hypothetical protein
VMRLKKILISAVLLSFSLFGFANVFACSGPEGCGDYGTFVFVNDSSSTVQFLINRAGHQDYHSKEISPGSSVIFSNDDWMWVNMRFSFWEDSPIDILVLRKGPSKLISADLKFIGITDMDLITEHITDGTWDPEQLKVSATGNMVNGNLLFKGFC